jgi:hypothetical protein
VLQRFRIRGWWWYVPLGAVILLRPLSAGVAVSLFAAGVSVSADAVGEVGTGQPTRHTLRDPSGRDGPCGRHGAAAPRRHAHFSPASAARVDRTRLSRRPALLT